MRDHKSFARWTILGATIAVVAAATGAAHADTPPAAAAPPPAPEPPPAPAPATVAPAPPLAPAPLPPMAPPPVEAKPPTATESMPATRPDVLPPIDVGAWVRAGSIFQGVDHSKINDWHMDNAYVELHTGGKITKNVGVTLNLNANMLDFNSPNAPSPHSVAIEDAIISFDFVDEFHLWAGHLLVPVDRSNSSGPFFMIPWNYPGFFAAGNGFVGAPAEGPSGRNNGAMLWGDIAGGRATYFAGVYDNANVAGSPLFSARLRLPFLDSETGFWGNGSYFGAKDILTLDVGGQVQDHGSTSGGIDKTYAEVNADLLFEKKIPGGGWFTADGAYYHFNVNDGGVSDSLYVLAAYASPTVGVGNLQPMVRYQWEKVKSNPGTNPWNLDVGLSYLIKGPALRVLATYSYTNLGPSATGPNPTANSIQLGAQAIFF